MSRIFPPSAYKIMLKLFACVLVLAPMGIAQVTGSALDSTRTKLASIRSCLGSKNWDIDYLRQGLIEGWGTWNSAGAEDSQPIAPPPPEYLSSLDRDIEACDFASTLKDKAQRKSVLNAVAEDIRIKADDCRRNGMGRTISVRVVTVRGTTPENGWEVYYKWDCSCAFQPAEMRAPLLTSPATVQLPPGSGVWSIRAQKKDSNTQTINTGPVMIPISIGSPQIIDFQLPIQ